MACKLIAGDTKVVALLDVAIYSWDGLMLGGGVDLLWCHFVVARAKLEKSKHA